MFAGGREGRGSGGKKGHGESTVLKRMTRGGTPKRGMEWPIRERDEPSTEKG